MKILTIVIPVYYNESSLEELFRAIKIERDRLISHGIDIQVIAVDDGSGDNSLDKLIQIRESYAGVDVIKLTRNFGSWPAIKSALNHIKCDGCIILSADLQDPPSLIYDMAKEWIAGHKFIICERVSRDDPIISKLFSALYYKFIQVFVLKAFPKGGFDLVLMDKDLLPYMKNSSKSSYMALLVFSLGYPPKVIKYHRRIRPHGKSRWTFQKKLKVFLDALLGFSVTPIRVISAIGAIVSLISFIYGAIIIFYSLILENTTPGFASLASLITFLLGLIILMLGVIGEYLWRIFDESNKRPEYVIDKIYKS